MRIRILRIVEERAGITEVTFWSSAGTAQADWMGALPDVGGTYDVEVEITETLVWGDSIRAAASQMPSVSTENGKIVITGLLEACEDDGFATLRVGDALLLVETEGQPAPLGTAVQVVTGQIRLFDANT